MFCRVVLCRDIDVDYAMNALKPLLMLQFRTDAGIVLEQASVLEKLSQDIVASPPVHFLDALDAHNDALFADPAVLLSRYRGVILGGSAELYFGGNNSRECEEKHEAMLVRLRPLVTYMLTHDFPTLGICFGHQLLTTFLGEKVVADSQQSETGQLCVRLSDAGKQDPLFAGMPDDWKAFFMHRDSAQALPEGAVLLACGERSRIGAFRYKTRIYGVQFHPELDRHDHMPRLALHPEYIHGNIEDFLETLEWVPHARKVLHNFLNMTHDVAFAPIQISDNE